MKCEACGGDGLIEYGAYRGAEDTDTRECRLCGGPRPVLNIPAGTPIDAAVKALTQLGQVANRAEIAMKDALTPAMDADTAQRLRIAREVVERVQRRKKLEQAEAANPELRKWRESGYVPATVPPPNPVPRTPQDVAREYAQRLNAENERQQQEAETNRTMNELIREEHRKACYSSRK